MVKLLRLTLTTLMLLTGAVKGYAMEANAALRLVQDWGRDSRDMQFIGQMKVDASGGFTTRASGAFFRYEPGKGRLLVSGLIGYNNTIHKKYTDTWEKLIRAGDREKVTLGGGQFELYVHQLFHLEPDVVLITKAYTEDGTDSRQFAVEVRWLLSAANYWLIKRYNEVLVKPESVLVEQAPGINARWPMRPW